MRWRGAAGPGSAVGTLLPIGHFSLTLPCILFVAAAAIVNDAHHAPSCRRGWAAVSTAAPRGLRAGPGRGCSHQPAHAAIQLGHGGHRNILWRSTRSVKNFGCPTSVGQVVLQQRWPLRIQLPGLEAPRRLLGGCCSQESCWREEPQLPAALATRALCSVPCCAPPTSCCALALLGPLARRWHEPIRPQLRHPGW